VSFSPSSRQDGLFGTCAPEVLVPLLIAGGGGAILAASGEFNDRETLEAWLKDQPHELCSAIGTRAALRVLPLVFRLFEVAERQLSSEEKKRATLDTCRSAFIAWAANVYASGITKKLITECAVAAVGAANSAASAASSASPSASSAASAAAGAAGSVAADPAVTPTTPTTSDVTAGTAVLAATAAAHAAVAARAADGEALVWDSIRADANWLVDHPKGSLIQQALWLIDVRGDTQFQTNFPLWAREPFDAFKKNVLVKNGPWGVWLAWYDDILSNIGASKPQSRFEKADIEIASKDDKFWLRAPDVVTAEMADIFGWRWDEPKKPPPESVEPQSDEPTSDDQLGRRPFAQALVERMDKLYEKGGGDGFAAHIHAPWGAGKTSVLWMMRDLMNRKAMDDNSAARWVVVYFNAWQHERRNPPWWPLLEMMKTECAKSLPNSDVRWFRLCKACCKSLWHIGDRTPDDKDQDQAALLQARWVWWKIRTDALPYLIALVVAALCLWVLWHLEKAAGGGASTTLEWILKLFTAAVTIFAVFFGASRTAFFGSATAAKFYEDISQDPLKRITGLFKSIVEKTNKPVCVFIDDLDRCRADYVVDLLEGIQTSFRHKNVVYVVAADRSWIKASFEARYSTFSNAVGSVGQPLGYLFLEKIFQVSMSIPGMGDKTRSAYWNGLLRGAALSSQDGQQVASPTGKEGPPLRAVSSEQFDRAVESKRADLRETHGQNITGGQAQAILETSDTPVDRAAVFLELNASREAEKEAEHLLARFTDIVPDNPRVMKRMINAFAMRRAIGILERNATPTPTLVLARWTILEQRLPALADLLIEHPEWTQRLTDEVGDNDREKLPPVLRPFADSEVVRNIIGKGDVHGLTVDHVRMITRGSAT
jgi:hypothetical protein